MSFVFFGSCISSLLLLLLWMEPMDADDILLVGICICLDDVEEVCMVSAAIVSKRKLCNLN